MPIPMINVRPLLKGSNLVHPAGGRPLPDDGGPWPDDGFTRRLVNENGIEVTPDSAKPAPGQKPDPAPALPALAVQVAPAKT
jgi:hypothetical protein